MQKVMHRGIQKMTIPAVKRERMISDPTDTKFGAIVEETVAEAYDVELPLTVDHGFGSRDTIYMVGRMYVVDDEVAESLIARRQFSRLCDADGCTNDAASGVRCAEHPVETEAAALTTPPPLEQQSTVSEPGVDASGGEGTQIGTDGLDPARRRGGRDTTKGQGKD